MERRDFLRLSLALGVSGLVGCGSETKPPRSQERKPIPSATPTPENSARIPVPQDILSLYPELNPSGIRSYQSIETQVRQINIANMTNYSINIDWIKEIADQMLLTSTQGSIDTYTNPAINNRLDYKLKPRDIRPQHIYITNEHTPNPKWANFDHPATTFLPTDPKLPYLSHLKPTLRDVNDPYFNTAEKLMNAFLAVEICQGTIEVLGRTPQDADIMQEVYCNSLGRAMTIRKFGGNYKDYLDHQQNTTLLTPIGELGLIQFSEEEFLQFPD